jgi:hypothetical protein
VQVIEKVAANPGRLAEPDVLGAVVVLSDGGDNCAEDPAAVVSRVALMPPIRLVFVHLVCLVILLRHL